MDENTFIREWVQCSREVRPAVGDVRAAVWGRLAALGVDRVPAPTVLPPGRLLVEVDLAAAAVIAAGSAVVYSSLAELFRVFFWNGDF